ncbi:type II toxin-antitoxin system RelE/ParE family toxin [Dyadobacter luticola]|uniref:Toxin n=1 Tax=Dyadobacter luticola TaxID=1979387 RepID=A0A5R9L1K4_9BACT|nr:type II toxin-antitoxin system RelE/ParE family toxin [Dyadobacter luticola]TLV02160.1 type II toxin-antitoxin system RelE/ParE family toxin [Dyadobacter luticola]
MPEYRLTIPAQNDLEKIWEYTADEWSIRQADKYLDGLVSIFNALADRKIKGKRIDLIRKNYKEISFMRHHVFFQETLDGTIEIMRILHVSMDVESHL